jgi:hypothetical protein
MNHVQKRRTEDIQIAQGQSAKHLNQFHSEVLVRSEIELFIEG